MFITITITGVLEKSSEESSKQGIQATWPTTLSRFRGAYRTHTASEVKLFVILAAFGRCIRELGIVCCESPRSTSAFYWDF